MAKISKSGKGFRRESGKLRRGSSSLYSVASGVVAGGLINEFYSAESVEGGQAN